MKILYLLPLLFLSSFSSAQIMQLYDPVANKPFNAEKYSGIRGTPFQIDKWYKGSVITTKGIYDDLQLKLDAYENKLYFNRDDQTFEFQEPVVSFILKPKPSDSSTYMNFEKGITGNSLSPNQFVQVLVKGNITLYKSDIKSLTEMSEINAGMVKTFTTISRYYLVKDNVVTLVKINKSDILPLLKSQEEKINAYMSQHKISLRKENDLIEIIAYYNLL